MDLAGQQDPIRREKKFNPTQPQMKKNYYHSTFIQYKKSLINLFIFTVWKKIYRGKKKLKVSGFDWKPDPVTLGLTAKLDPVAFGTENRKDNTSQQRFFTKKTLRTTPSRRYNVVHSIMSLYPQYMHSVFLTFFKVEYNFKLFFCKFWIFSL